MPKRPEETLKPYGTQLAGLVLVGWLGATLGVLFNYLGTVDSGDSIRHFQYAAWAWKHPENLLNHWAKPFFTLLASVPATLGGMVGMKIFNCCMIMVAALSASRIASFLIPRLGGLAGLFVVASPMVFLSQFSGLTEPLFAAMLGVATARLLLGKYRGALIIAGFLPFVRTEGFLLLPVFALYVLVHWWQLRREDEPKDRLGELSFVRMVGLGSWLLLGTVVYSVAGGLFLGDWTWIFTENPYDTHADNYGMGDWGHFPRNFLFVVGVPIYGLWLSGWAASLVAGVQELAIQDWAKRPLRALGSHNGAWRTIYALFGAYFGAHVVFWATGTAHSMGLLRVMIALAPLSALIALRGMLFLLDLVAKWNPIRSVLLIGIPLYAVIFLFTPNQAALKPSDFELTRDQELLRELALNSVKEDMEARYLYARHPYAATAFERDPFSEVLHLRHVLQDNMDSGSLVLWDGWFGVKEAGIPYEFWEENAEKYVPLYEERRISRNGTPIHMLLLRVK